MPSAAAVADLGNAPTAVGLGSQVFWEGMAAMARKMLPLGRKMGTDGGFCLTSGAAFADTPPSRPRDCNQREGSR